MTNLIDDPSRNFNVNVCGTFTILDAMRRRGTRLIINASTSVAILGDGQRRSTTDSAVDAIFEQVHADGRWLLDAWVSR